MRLRSKFFLLTAAATMLPIVGSAVVGRSVVRRNSEARFAQVFERGELVVRQKLAALSQRLNRSASWLADPRDHFVGPILMALVKAHVVPGADRGVGGTHSTPRAELDDELLRRLPAAAPRVMRERGLDVLTVVLDDGRVLASGHFAGRAGKKGGLPPVALRFGRPRLTKVRVIADGQPQDRLAQVVWKEVRFRDGPRLWIEAGKVVGDDFLRSLRFDSPTVVILRDAKGRRLAGPSVEHPAQAHYPRREIALKGGDGAPVAWVSLAVSDQQLRTTLDIINYGSLALAVAALLLALLVGTLARPITRPLERLALAAEAVAGGDLEYRIAPGGRDEVGELVTSFNRMIVQLNESKASLAASERVAAWREIARRIAHEIKNPLSPIQTSIENLRKAYGKKHPELDEIFEESTLTILEEVTRMKRIVSEFSSFARMAKPESRRFNLKDWLVSVVGMYGGGYTSLDDALDSRCEIAGDREQLTQVMVNLLSNARDAVRDTESPSILVSCHPQEGWYQLEVTDNGVGFGDTPPQDLFVPYVSTKGAAGTGLGLAICHRIVADHGGTIEAHGGKEGGARFVVRLPILGDDILGGGE